MGKQLGFPSFDMEALVMAFGDLLDETRSTRQTVANRRGAGEKPFKLKLLGNKDGLWQGKTLPETNTKSSENQWYSMVGNGWKMNFL